MDKLLIEKNIKEALEKIKNEINDNNKEVLCEWRANHADISVVDKETSHVSFESRIYDNGLYYLKETENNYQNILDTYFENSNNLIDYNEFKDLLNIDKGKINFFDIEEGMEDYYFSLEKEFADRLKRENIELRTHNDKLTFVLEKNNEENNWNVKTFVENTLASNFKGDYEDCFNDLRSQIKYENIFMELARQEKIFNLNNINEKGEKEGLWVEPKTEEKELKKICFYENGKLNGKFAEIHDNNNLAEIGNYKDNVKEGKSFSYYNDTLNLSEEKNYEKGILNGSYKSFIYTGELHCEGNMKNGEFDGTLKTYDTKDNKLYLFQTMEYKDGLGQGPAINYFPNGDIKEKFNMKNGELFGEAVEYYHNGNIKSIENYENSKLNGLKTDFYENGNVKEKANYSNDFLNGTKTEYLENGSKIKEYEYNKGLMEQELFYKKGQLERVKDYELGNLKEEKTYDENFNKSMVFTYKEDNTVNWKGYYPNGNLKFDNNLKDNLFIGSSKLYYENGNLMESSNYIIKGNEALKDGDYKAFAKDGTLVENLKYQEGKIIENILKKDNPWEKTSDNEKDNNPWEAKISNNKDNQWER